MIDKIVIGLQTDYPVSTSDGQGFTWIAFGDGIQPSPPYGVVKGEKGINGRGIRVILHRNQGQGNQLEDDLRAVVQKLNEKSLTSRNGNNNQLSRLQDYMDVNVISDDNTISMEALFLMPTTTF